MPKPSAAEQLIRACQSTLDAAVEALPGPADPSPQTPAQGVCDVAAHAHPQGPDRLQRASHALRDAANQIAAIMADQYAARAARRLAVAISLTQQAREELYEVRMGSCYAPEPARDASGPVRPE